MSSVSREGLYIMVAVSLFASCSASDKLDRIERKMNDWPNVVVTPVEPRNTNEPNQYPGIVQTQIEIPDYCLTEYQYPRSQEQTRRCFEHLIEELREISND